MINKNSKRYWIFTIRILLLTLLSTSSFAEKSPKEVFNEANNLYKKGDYITASKYYESILSKGYQNFEVHYNIANAYFKQKDYAKAILHYERAKKYDISNEDVKFNLQLANLNTVDKIEPLEEPFFLQWFNTLPTILTANGWGTISIILFFIGLGFGVIYLYGQNIKLRRLGFFIGIILVLFGSLTIFLARASQKASETPYAIVIAPITYIKNAPQETASDAFYLHAGTKVKIIEKQGEWMNIQIPDGKKGWSKISEVEGI